MTDTTEATAERGHTAAVPTDARRAAARTGQAVMSGAAHPAPPVLGWKERVYLPEWDLRLRAKLDTGARTSALHVTELEERGAAVDPATGEELTVVRFDVVLGRKDAPEHHEVEAPVIGHRRVRDTGARSERRPVVRTRIVCGPVDVTADITLTDRTGMNFRMLLGRLTLHGHCVVDPARGYLTGRRTRGAAS